MLLQELVDAGATHYLRTNRDHAFFSRATNRPVGRPLLRSECNARVEFSLHECGTQRLLLQKPNKRKEKNMASDRTDPVLIGRLDNEAERQWRVGEGNVWLPASVEKQLSSGYSE